MEYRKLGVCWISGVCLVVGQSVQSRCLGPNTRAAGFWVGASRVQKNPPPLYDRGRCWLGPLLPRWGVAEVLRF
ncbi:hypothetical protein B0T22DRAFT_470396 [Podospora appendiculata]|uniref:Secreted protein n=1 Tax=Podospora appendiculata TaxID=314037 RepID=A0AAE0X0G6_9PEZI|nr:hypothetical protein B0T22DRAFT_470396 [Podospora appendiculata]